VSDTSGTATLSVDASGNTTVAGALTATGAITADGGLSVDSAITTDQNVGAAAGTGVVAVEQGIGPMHRTVLTLTDTPIVLSDAAGVVAYGGTKIYDFPGGLIMWHGAIIDLTVTKSSAGVNDDWDGDVALGVQAAGSDGTLTAGEAVLVPSTATPQASSGETTAKALSTSTEMGTAGDGTATPLDVYLNFLVDDADHDVGTTPCNLIANGTIVLTWTYIGDYA